MFFWRTILFYSIFNLYKQTHKTIEQQDTTEYDTVFTKECKVVFFHIAGQETNGNHADRKGNTHGNQEQEQLSKTQELTCFNKFENL